MSELTAKNISASPVSCYFPRFIKSEKSNQMKKTFALLIAAVLFASVGRAGAATIKVSMTTGPDEEPATSFPADTPKVYAIFKTKGIKSGDKVRGVLIAEDVGTVAPPNTKVLEKTLDMDEDTQDGDFNFSKPTAGWPPGKYRVEIYLNDALATSVKFTIMAGKSEKKDSDDSKKDSDD